MNDIHEVTGCADCPFLYDGIECRVPGSNVRDADNDDWWAAQDEGRPPAACPLLVAPSLVRIRAKVLP